MIEIHAHVMRIPPVINHHVTVGALGIVHLQRKLVVLGRPLPLQVQTVNGGLLQKRRLRLTRRVIRSGKRDRVGIRALAHLVQSGQSESVHGRRLQLLERVLFALDFVEFDEVAALAVVVLEDVVLYVRAVVVYGVPPQLEAVFRPRDELGRLGLVGLARGRREFYGIRGRSLEFVQMHLEQGFWILTTRRRKHTEITIFKIKMLYRVFRNDV